MSETLMLQILLFALGSLVGWGLIGVALSGRRAARQRSERERSRATGTVAEHIKKRYHRRRGPSVVFWYPVVEFEANGRRYRLQSDDNISPEEFPVGAQIELLYDADNPERFHLESAREYARVGDRNMILIGVGWIAACAILIALFVR